MSLSLRCLAVALVAGDSAARLAPGVIATGDVFASSLTPDGRVLLFSRIAYAGEERRGSDVYAVRTAAVPALRALRALLAAR